MERGLIISQNRRMKKHSKFFIKHEKKVKSLLEELTQRELESTQLKISELISQQRSNLTALRSLKAQAVGQLPVHRPKVHYDLFESDCNTDRSRNKENKLLSGQVGGNKPHLSSQKSRERMTTCDQIKHILTERSHRNEEKREEHYFLPEIASMKISKRNSIQNCVEDQPAGVKSIHQITELAIIEENVSQPRPSKPSNPLKALRLHKQRSLAMAHL